MARRKPPLLRRFGLALAAWLAAFAAVAAEGLPGQWLDGRLPDQGKDAGRDYKLYVPASYRGAPLPLVVMLHGCLQGPDSFAASTRMNLYAESGQFLVLYPAQRLTANPVRCWNWFRPENQVRDAGEPAQIVAMVGAVAGRYAVDRSRVYVAGLSAGASMAAILAACYPDVFAAAAIHDGTMYKAADGLIAAERSMLTGKAPDPEALAGAAWDCGGRRRLAMPVMVWHGQGDNIVNRDHGDLLVRQFARLNDLADDGLANGSAPQGPRTQGGQVGGGHAYTVASYDLQGRPLIEYYQVAAMGHAWSGGKADSLFTDPEGPDASLLIWNFFRRYRR